MNPPVVPCRPGELVLLLPGLVPARRVAAEHGVPRLESLETLLARAARASFVGGGASAVLGALVPDLAPFAPIGPAALSRLADTGQRHEGWWLRADPVHLVTGIDHVRLVHTVALRVREDEAIALAAHLNEDLGASGFRLEAQRADRWYLGSQRELRARTYPPGAVAGRNVLEFLPVGEDGPVLKRLLTEAQMLLHEHVVNRERTRAGLLEINSIWLWGGGRLPARAPRVCALPDVWSDDSVVRGLCSLAGGRCRRLPVSVDACLVDGISRGAAALFHGLQEAVWHGDPALCLEALEQLEDRWCKPLLEALSRRRLARLRIAAHGLAFELTGRSLHKRWRRARPLQAFFPDEA